MAPLAAAVLLLPPPARRRPRASLAASLAAGGASPRQRPSTGLYSDLRRVLGDPVVVATILAFSLYNGGKLR